MSWVELFVPPIWRKLDAALRAQAISERHRIDADIAAGKPRTRLIIWVADEKPIMGTGNTALFNVLVVGEGQWIAGEERPELRLRLARAMPDRSTAAWLVAFSELSGPEGPDMIWPDYLVCDSSSSLLKAADIHFNSRRDNTNGEPIERVKWVPSVWHLSNAIRNLVEGKETAGWPTKHADLECHLNLLRRGDDDEFLTLMEWSEWWEKAENIVEKIAGTPAQRAKRAGALASRRDTYGKQYNKVLPDFEDSFIPISSGGIEELIRSRIEPLFSRRKNFTNLERTNSLTDLAVARDRFALDDLAKVTALLRDDTNRHGGWTGATRDVADPSSDGARYASLHDRSKSARIAYDRGLM